MMSLSAYGRHRGCSHEAVRRAVRSGRLVKSVTYTDKGKAKIADPDLADQEWEANTAQMYRQDPKAIGDGVSRAKGGDGVTRSPLTLKQSHASKVPTPPAGSGGGSAGDSPLNKARAARETYEARIAEFKYRKMKDELVDAAEVKREFATASRRVRDSLLAVPDRIASVIAAETDPDRVHRLLIEEIEQTLTSLADHGAGDDEDGAGDG